MHLRHNDAVSTPTDSEDLEALRNGKPDAFQAFFESWFSRVHRFATLRVGPGRAERITERVLCDALGQIQSGAMPPELGPWLLTLVKRELAASDAS